MLLVIKNYRKFGHAVICLSFYLPFGKFSEKNPPPVERGKEENMLMFIAGLMKFDEKLCRPQQRFYFSNFLLAN